MVENEEYQIFPEIPSSRMARIIMKKEFIDEL